MTTIRDGSLTGVIGPWILQVAQNIKIENDFDNKLAQKLPKSVSILRTPVAPTKAEITHETSDEDFNSLNENFDTLNEDFEDIDNNENEEVAQNIKIENDFDNKLAQKLPKSVSILRTQAAPTKIEIQHEPAKEKNDKNFDSLNEDFEDIEDFEDFDNDEDYDPDQGNLLKGINNKTVRT